MARSARGRQPSRQPREAAGGLTARRGWTSLVRERMAGKCERRDWNPRAGIPEAGSMAPRGLHPSLARHRHGSHTGCCRADDPGFRAPRPLGPRPALAAWPAVPPDPRRAPCSHLFRAVHTSLERQPQAARKLFREASVSFIESSSKYLSFLLSFGIPLTWRNIHNRFSSV